MEKYEHLRPEELDFVGGYHEVKLAINGIARTFNTSDTAMWLFDKHPMLNHIIQWHEDGTASAWYGIDEDDMDTLHEAGVTMITPLAPTITQIGHWWTIEMQDFDRELTNYNACGELFPDEDS